MSEFSWNDELTVFAKKNLKHQTWSTCPYTDLLAAIKMKSEGKYDPKAFGRKNDDDDIIQFLRHFHIVDEQDQLTIPDKKTPFYSGEYIAQCLMEEGQNSETGKHAIGHNFLMGARECLELARELSFPGKSKTSIENQFLNRIVFNNKLNSFKLDNGMKKLEALGIVTENKPYGFYVTYSPAPMTFYTIGKRYLLDASYRVGDKVNAKSMIEYTKMMLPSHVDPLNDYRQLGLANMPFEGWGKYKVWLTPDSFSDLLRLGLIDPVDVIEVIKTLYRNNVGSKRESYKLVLEILRKAFSEEWEAFRGEKPTDYQEMLEKYEIKEDNCVEN